MLCQGVIQEFTLPWNSLLLIAPKKDETWRPVIDICKVNAITVPDKFSLPDLNDLLKNLGKNRMFTTLDLVSGF